MLMLTLIFENGATISFKRYFSNLLKILSITNNYCNGSFEIMMASIFRTSWYRLIDFSAFTTKDM